MRCVPAPRAYGVQASLLLAARVAPSQTLCGWPTMFVIDEPEIAALSERFARTDSTVTFQVLPASSTVTALFLGGKVARGVRECSGMSREDGRLVPNGGGRLRSEPARDGCLA